MSTSTNDISYNLISLVNHETSPTQSKAISSLAQILLESIPLSAYKLTTEQMFWIQKFIKVSPKSFDTIVADIQKITEDGKIDVQDIPMIVKLFADVYHSDAIDFGLVDAKNVIAFIKFTLLVILDSNLLVIPDTEKKTIEAVVDASLSLLAMNIDTIEAIQKKGYGCFTIICPSWNSKK